MLRADVNTDLGKRIFKVHITFFFLRFAFSSFEFSTKLRPTAFGNSNEHWETAVLMRR